MPSTAKMMETMMGMEAEIQELKMGILMTFPPMVSMEGLQMFHALKDENPELKKQIAILECEVAELKKEPRVAKAKPSDMMVDIIHKTVIAENKKLKDELSDCIEELARNDLYKCSKCENWTDVSIFGDEQYCYDCQPDED